MITPTGTNCALCDEVKPLRQSHIFPAFVFRWLRTTSATGYFRNVITPNIRFQDGPKRPLLCSDCEALFSEAERKFAKQIFHPYVSEELSEEGVATGRIAHFEYEDWLLRFVISLHWRLVSIPEDRSYLPDKLLNLLNITRNIWRDFLLKKRDNTGENQTYLFLLQNLASGHGYLPGNINDRVNFYLLRATDFSPIVNNSRDFGIYSKIGPIAFYTSLKPGFLKNTSDARIGMRGKLKTVQRLRNSLINNFIFIDRPNQAFPELQFSENQAEVIRKSYLKNADRVAKSLTIKAYEADIIIRQLKELQEIDEA